MFSCLKSLWYSGINLLAFFVNGFRSFLNKKKKLLFLLFWINLIFDYRREFTQENNNHFFFAKLRTLE